MTKARIIAFYLPQYYPTPENDTWWGKGFTEWTNVGKMKPLFKGHYQPRVPADLGYYDLRVPETRIAQAEMAKEHGIEGFMYWHYWFGNGRKLLDRPFHEVLNSGSPDFPFCLGWANESWKGFSYGAKGRNLLIEQLYPGEKDFEQHFYDILPALKDERYITVDGKPLFLLFRPLQLPNPNQFIEQWQNLAVKNGLKGIYFIGQTYDLNDIDEIINKGYNAVNIIRQNYCFNRRRNIFNRIRGRIIKAPNVVNYKKAIKYLIGDKELNENIYPTLIPNWDHSARTGSKGNILHDSTPLLFENHLTQVLDVIKNKAPQNKIVFLKSWNEWAEGNYIEPDLKFGLGYLDVLKNKLK